MCAHRIELGFATDVPQAHGALAAIPETSPANQQGGGGGSRPSPAVAAAASSPRRKRKADGPLQRGSPKPLKPVSPVKKGGPGGSGSPKQRTANRAYKKAFRRIRGPKNGKSPPPQASAPAQAPPNPTPATIGTVSGRGVAGWVGAAATGSSRPRVDGGASRL